MNKNKIIYEVNDIRCIYPRNRYHDTKSASIIKTFAQWVRKHMPYCVHISVGDVDGFGKNWRELSELAFELCEQNDTHWAWVEKNESSVSNPLRFFEIYFETAEIALMFKLRSK